MKKKSSPIIIISVVTVILLAALVGILVYFNLPAQRIRRMLKTTTKYIAEENYDEAIKVANERNYKMKIISVSTIDDALKYLQDNYN